MSHPALRIVSICWANRAHSATSCGCNSYKPKTQLLCCRTTDVIEKENQPCKKSQNINQQRHFRVSLKSQKFSRLLEVQEWSARLFIFDGICIKLETLKHADKDMDVSYFSDSTSAFLKVFCQVIGKEIVWAYQYHMRCKSLLLVFPEHSWHFGFHGINVSIQSFVVLSIEAWYNSHCEPSDQSLNNYAREHTQELYHLQCFFKFDKFQFGQMHLEVASLLLFEQLSFKRFYQLHWHRTLDVRWNLAENSRVLSRVVSFDETRPVLYWSKKASKVVFGLLCCRRDLRSFCTKLGFFFELTKNEALLMNDRRTSIFCKGRSRWQRRTPW